MKIHYVSTHYPDARILVKERNKWVIKKVEFELSTSSFKSHIKKYKKDKSSCDMIICWEDDWKKKPKIAKNLKILELKGELKKII